MIEEALNPIRHAKSLAKKVRARLQDYLSVRPHRSLRLTRRKKMGGKKLPSILSHVKSTLAFMRREKKIFFVLGSLLAVTGYFVAGGVPQSDFLALKEGAQNLILGDWGQVGVVATLFVTTVAGAAASAGSDLQQFMGALLTFIFWLTFIWTTRMRLADQKIKARDALYNSTAPLVSSLVILVIIAVQALPAFLGIFALSTAEAGGYLGSGVETMMFVLAAAILCLLSAYWISASVVALVAVSLPQTYPFHALAAASQLVIGQRWKLLMHLVTLVVLTLLGWILVLVPALALDGWLRFEWLPLVPIVAQAMTAFSLIFATVYSYRLYRSML